MPEIHETCCFTGHREAKLPWGSNEHDPRCQRLRVQLCDAAEAVYADGIRHFICGMANGADLFFLEAVLRLRETHPDVTAEAAVPYAAQAARWRPALRARYDALLAQCDFRTLVQREYTPDCMMRRNRYMVDHSRILIAAYSGASGGTQQTLLYAIRRKLRIISLPLDELEYSRAGTS